jgi:hypothetical protein
VCRLIDETGRSIVVESCHFVAPDSEMTVGGSTKDLSLTTLHRVEDSLCISRRIEVATFSMSRPLGRTFNMSRLRLHTHRCGSERVTVLNAPFTAEEVTNALSLAQGTRSFTTILIDDIEAISVGSDVDDTLRAYVREATSGSVMLIVAGLSDDVRSALRGTIVEAKRAKKALIFSPTSTLDGDLAGERIARNYLGRAPAGRGVFLSNGDVSFIQVPLIE